MELKDFLASINQTKDNLMESNDEIESSYPAWVVNRALSHHTDALFQANDMNSCPWIDRRLQYDFLLHSVKTRKRYAPWLRPEEITALESVKTFFDYSTKQAKAALRVLTEDDLALIQRKVSKGGTQ